MKRQTRTATVFSSKSTNRRRSLLHRLRGVESLESRNLMAVSIGDYVWNDLNTDGIQNESPSDGVNGVEVKLFSAAGAQFGSSTITDNNSSGNPGYYAFNDVPAGDYYVVFVRPVGKAFTTRFAGSDTGLDSEVDLFGKSSTFSISVGASEVSIDAGLVPESRIGTFVWWDQDENGLQIDVEGGIRGVVVQLLQDGNVITSTTTVGGGQYEFNGLPAGTYSVKFQFPVGFDRASPPNRPSLVPGRDDQDDSDGVGPELITAPITLATGAYNASVDQGFYKSVNNSAVGNYVWRDNNSNGLQDEGPAFGVNGVTVTLFTAANVQVGSSTVTSNDASGDPGYYQIPIVLPGSYYLIFTPPGNQPFTDQYQGAFLDFDIDSDVDSSGRADFFKFGVYDDLTIDAGLRPLIDLSLTSNVTDFTPPVGSNITYSITVSNASGFSPASGVTVKDVLPATGLDYQFDTSFGAYNSATRTWTIGTVQPGTSVTLQVNCTVLTGGTKINVAQIQTADQQDFDSTPGNALNVSEDDDSTLSLTPSASIGNYVWRDENSDGIQNEPNSAGLNGVTVALLTSTGTQVGSAVVTANDGAGNPGYYLFSDIDPGAYYVVVSAPTGQTFTTQFSVTATSATDSNVDSNGKSNTFTLVSGVDDLSIDAGLKTGQICAVLDFNGTTATSGTLGNIRTFTSGSISVNASGFSRDKTTGAWASAYLGSYGGGLGVTDFSEGAGVNDKHTVDNVEGRDNYILFEFNQAVVIDSAYLGYVVGDSDLTVWIGTFPNAFNNHQSLSDILLAGLYTESNLTTLTTVRLADLNANGILGNFIVIAADVNDTSPEDYFKLAHMSVCTPGTQQPASLGDFVWHDLNGNGLQDQEELGIQGANVTLTGGGADGVINGMGDTVLSTTTNSVGAYSFTDLTPGTQYRLAFTLPTGFTLASPRKQGTDAALDSDGLVSDIVILGSGQNNTTIDAGFYNLDTVKSCVNLYLEGNTSTSGTAGNIITFSSGSISAKASAFSRDTAGSWATAYLGRYGGGLGVTDTSEGNGSNNTHTVDNIGRNNYVLFEFSQGVTIDTAFLGYVSGDSDLRVWIGNAANAFNSHYTLSDAFLTGLGFSEVNLGSGSTRTADLNSGNLTGNILVVSAKTDESNDQFKIAELGLCAQIPTSNAGTKFFSVDDHTNRTYKYGSLGDFTQNFAIAAKAPRGITSNISGSNVWIANKDGKIYNYTSSGSRVAVWSSKINELEGVTTNGTHIWTVSDRTDRVYYYPNGTTYADGASVNPSTSFALDTYNNNPTDLTTDGTFIWVVNEGNIAGGVGDMVFKYSLSGTYLGRWQLDAANARPTGITVDPAGGNKLWIVDNSTDSIYEYSGATGCISGGLVAAKSYALAAGNTNPQGIADPPGSSDNAVTAESSLAVNEQYINPEVNPFFNSFNATDVNSDGVTSPMDALLVINRLNAKGHGQPLESKTWMYDDVSNDGTLSPLDALLVINQLNSGKQAAPVSETLPTENVGFGSGSMDNTLPDLGEGEGLAGTDAYFANYNEHFPENAAGSEAERNFAPTDKSMRNLKRNSRQR